MSKDVCVREQFVLKCQWKINSRSKLKMYLPSKTIQWGDKLVILEKLTVTQLVKKYFASYGTRSSSTVLTRASTDSCPVPDESSLF
jgi:hypothetical protein